MRENVFSILENKSDSLISKSYNLLMLVTIFLSIVPLMFKEHLLMFTVFEYVTTAVFCMDYILRWVTADFKLGKGKASFVLYPLTIMAIVDLLCILPTFFMMNSGLKLLKIARMGRLLRVFKVIRYSKNIAILTNVMKEQREALLLVIVLATGYILFTALLMFTVEPTTFDTFFDALYWATISLTTVGYGDIFAVSTLGKLITMVSSVLGIAIVALPAGIITAGYMNEIMKNQ
ncbi:MULTISPECIES: ion transporter [Streptococcus]|uniref:Ion transporter n=1 Tax=Streptococcus caledonicus TaxID=2614158 RepID=A0ABW0UG30_9STRE|nr:ion transporter [Streptococcus sp. S784/96/1]